VSWYLTDIPRFRSEREGVEGLALTTDWLTLGNWSFDERFHLRVEADIVTGIRTFQVFLRYPDMFPHSPPSVFPRDEATRWSNHQFGPGGELCLEFGPDNWTSEMAGAQMLESAYRLLSQENPVNGEPEVVASRHQVTLGQQLRNFYSRLLVTPELATLFATLPAGTTVTGKLQSYYHERTTYIVTEVSSPENFAWKDTGIPETLIDEASERAVSILKVAESAELPPLDSLEAFNAGYSAMGFEVNKTWFAIVIRGADVNFYYLNEKENSVGSRAILPPQPLHQRLDESHRNLSEKSVALIGCGSLGSKIGSMLARSGVTRFALIDDDILFPDNLVRHDLDWRDVGSHKADALARRLNLVAPATQANARRVQLGGQESPTSAEMLLKLIGDCDLIVDATANSEVLNLTSALAAFYKKPIVWGEVFGGGIGGLVARSRPGFEPSPQHMRRAIENWFAERDATPVRSGRGYGAVAEDTPLIADDADVSVMAAHTARFAIDLLTGRDPSLFPASVYAIGLGVGSVFEQAFQTFPIEVGPLPATPVTPELSVEENTAEIGRLVALFKARADEASAAAGNN
jgi:hypothetical protein